MLSSAMRGRMAMALGLRAISKSKVDARTFRGCAGAVCFRKISKISSPRWSGGSSSRSRGGGRDGCIFSPFLRREGAGSGAGGRGFSSRGKSDWAEMLGSAERSCSTFSDADWASLFHKLGRLRGDKRSAMRKSRSFKRVVARLDEFVQSVQARDFGHKELAVLLHSLTAMGVRSSALLEKVCDAGTAQGIMEGANERTISSVAHSLAKLGSGKSFFDAMERSGGSVAVARTGTAQSIANTMWAAARLGYNATVLSSEIERVEIAEKLGREAKAQEVSNIIWALAKLGRKAPVFAEQLQKEELARRLVAEGKPQEIATTIWSMAKLGHDASVLAAKIDGEEVAEKLVRKGKPQEIANTVWAMAKLGYEARNLAGKIDTREVATMLVGLGKPQEIAVTFWALTSIGHQALVLASTIEMRENAQRLIEKGKPQEIAMVFWAMSKLNYDCPLLAGFLEPRVRSLMRGGNIQDIVSFPYALANLGYFDSSAFKEAATNVRIVAKGGTSQSVCNLLWSFCVAGKVKVHEGAVRVLWDEAMRRPSNAISKGDWRQLEICSLYAKSEGVDLRVKDEEKVVTMKTVSREFVHATATGMNEFQSRVVGDLTEFGYDGFETEVTPFEGEEASELMSIDIAWKREKVALELDGPDHFLITAEGGAAPQQEQERPMNGSSTAKTRMLENLGWKCRSFSYRENIIYESMSPSEKRKMWQTELEKFGVHPAHQSKPSSANEKNAKIDELRNAIKRLSTKVIDLKEENNALRRKRDKLSKEAQFFKR